MMNYECRMMDDECGKEGIIYLNEGGVSPLPHSFLGVSESVNCSVFFFLKSL